MSGGRNTKQGRPEPTAKDREAHEPEPEPQNARPDDDDGKRPAGQAEDGKDTHRPEPATQARATRTDRAANPPRPDPGTTEKTEAPGKDSRAIASAPGAQPTTTDDGEHEPHSQRAASNEGPTIARPPEKATTGKDETKARTEEETTEENMSNK